MLIREKIVRDAVLGKIRYVSSVRAQRLNLVVKGAHLVRVAVPRRVSFSVAEKFVSTHRNWIIRHEQKLVNSKKERSPTLVPLPEDIPAAAQRLFQRLVSLADKYQFTFRQVTFRNQKTRWGSCSRQNNINLNLKIAQLPDHLRDYILLHELVHTREKNHGPGFWQLLDTATNSRGKVYAKELRRYRLV